MTKTFQPTQHVKYIRVDAEGALIHGDGICWGNVIGLGKRLNVHVRDKEDPKKFYTLEPMAVDPTDEEAEAYHQHVLKLRGMGDDFNKRSDEAKQAIIDEGNLAIAAVNATFFGPEFDV